MYQKLTIVGKTWYIKTYTKSPPIYVYRSKKKRKIDKTSLTFRRRFSVSRTRNTLRNILSATLGNINETPTLITFTTLHGAPIKQAYRWLTRFYQLVSYHQKSKPVYVCVPEFQSRGAIHFHCLVWGISQNVTDKERDRRTLQNLWRRGYVDCVKTDGSGALAWYLVKYFDGVFSDSRLSGEKAYVASRSVSRPIVYKGIDAFKWDFGHGPMEDLAVENNLTCIKERAYSTQWLGEAIYKTYIPINEIHAKSADPNNRLLTRNPDTRVQGETVDDGGQERYIENPYFQDQRDGHNEA